ncbi:ribosome small subunit-dependent GTPase A [Natranaerobius thermophilus]|uniref:Small ribosomal subunit biogenesis GTPase RsgA n=1 Tax=Natranaerobius thermophilus (strain ATCC BAA-1301 / DSM 18059 / JW/NM-WN-LF) TaxID=457570 RepID=B2A2K9_NATTJ|nr:ribosome small subunit-dependent GTPase A [Natranaerobius thermophilus]ACB84924.1 ribosome small subunit-dependent GTPase A [Natranaerobius thermophilus JW/NM-WN-LF]
MQGRVVKIINDFYYVQGNEKNATIECKLKGNLIKDNNFPLVGDVVLVELTGEGQGMISDLSSRENRLVKPAVANVDQVIVVTSVKNPKPNLQLVDRLLVWAYFEGLQGMVCINKRELDYQKAQELAEIYKTSEINTTLISVKENDLDHLPKFFENKTSVLAGQSGVGKSSILNTLNPDLNLEVNPVSRKAGTGKHTTRHCQLLKAGGGFLVDTPGFNKKKLPEIVPEQLELAFPEIKKHSSDCKFNDCSHRKEPDCQVKKLVGTDIPTTRYEHFVKFFEELVDMERSF